MSNKEAKLAARRTYRSQWPRDARRRYRHLRTNKRGGTPSSSTGSGKQGCMASSWDRFCAKYSRARKDPNYQSWLDSHRRK